MLANIFLISSVSIGAPPPIVGGATDTEHPEVFLLAQGGVCSGTLIHSDWVLTAAHCVSGLSEANNLSVLAGVEPTEEEHDFLSEGLGIYIHPDYAPGIENGFDIALIQLAFSAQTIDPAILNDTSPAYWPSDTVLRLVGYGITGPGESDSGIRRFVDSDYYGYDDLWIAVNQPGNNYCTGDSGGATFFPSDIGFILSGVNAWVGADEGQDPCLEGIGGATRIDITLEWIMTHVPDVQVYSDFIPEPSSEPSSEPGSEPSSEDLTDTSEPPHMEPANEPKGGCQIQPLLPTSIMLLWMPLLWCRQDRCLG